MTLWNFIICVIICGVMFSNVIFCLALPARFARRHPLRAEPPSGPGAHREEAADWHHYHHHRTLHHPLPGGRDHAADPNHGHWGKPVAPQEQERHQSEQDGENGTWWWVSLSAPHFVTTHTYVLTHCLAHCFEATFFYLPSDSYCVLWHATREAWLWFVYRWKHQQSENWTDSDWVDVTQKWFQFFALLLVMSWNACICIWKSSIVPLGSGNHIFWPFISPPHILCTLWSYSPQIASSTSLLPTPGCLGSNWDLSALSSSFNRLHSAPFTHPPSLDSIRSIYPTWLSSPFALSPG